MDQWIISQSKTITLIRDPRYVSFSYNHYESYIKIFFQWYYMYDIYAQKNYKNWYSADMIDAFDR